MNVDMKNVLKMDYLYNSKVALRLPENFKAKKKAFDFS